MEHRFAPVLGGRLAENRLLLGGTRGWRLWVFDAERGRAWLRHNIEEQGASEQLLPTLYRRETEA